MQKIPYRANKSYTIFICHYLFSKHTGMKNQFLKKKKLFYFVYFTGFSGKVFTDLFMFKIKITKFQENCSFLRQ